MNMIPTWDKELAKRLVEIWRSGEAISSDVMDTVDAMKAERPDLFVPDENGLVEFPGLDPFIHEDDVTPNG